MPDPGRGASRRSRFLSLVSIAVLVVVMAAGLRDRHRVGAGQVLTVTATAFNSTPGQTDRDSVITAFGLELRSGARAIAVSHDLVADGLAPGTRVRIEGLAGEWVVSDRMARRWRRRIDIYMGNDVAAARAWGRREVRLTVLGPGDVRAAGVADVRQAPDPPAGPEGELATAPEDSVAAGPAAGGAELAAPLDSVAGAPSR